MISPLSFSVKAVDLSDKKYAADHSNVHRGFSFLKSCGTIKVMELRHAAVFGKAQEKA